MKKLHIASAIAISAFLICSCSNSPTGSEASNEGASAPPSGEAIYKKTCIACHQANGEGLPNTYPPLAKSDFIFNKENAIKQVIKGYTGEIVVNGTKYNSSMPGQQLSDDEIASVLTFVYNSFGNKGGSITTGEVKAIRAKL